MIYIGIDPGASGGIAVVANGWLETFPFKDRSLKDVWQWFKNLDVAEDHDHATHPGEFALIEKVGGYVSGDGFKAGSSAMFNFGKGVGHLEMALTASETPWEAVTPQAWQKGMGIPPRKPAETKTQFKNRLKAAAERLFPTMKVTLAVADALLIAEFCRRTRGK